MIQALTENEPQPQPTHALTNNPATIPATVPSRFYRLLEP
jgi:hypothetical protein